MSSMGHLSRTGPALAASGAVTVSVGSAVMTPEATGGDRPRPGGQGHTGRRDLS